MIRPELWRVLEVETEQTWIAPDPDDYEGDPDYRVWPVGLEEVTAQELAEIMDADLESANYHSSAGMHQYLAELLARQVGKTAALRIMAEIYTTHGWLIEIR